MASSNPHLLKSPSLFALFCMSYLPLFFLLIIKVIVANKNYLNYGGFTEAATFTFFEKFGFVLILLLLSIYALIGVKMTFRNIKSKKANAFPVIVSSIKPKNEEALSYLATYVIPLLMQGEIGLFEYTTFFILFILYYKLYSTSSLILINPILNTKYGLYEIEYSYNDSSENKTALIISQHRWIDEGEELKIFKLSHRLFFAF
ncbi:hypothetical protein [Flavisolibacter ginsengisoli]|jgi:hypothetical protein|uniref:Uncharacterized protein n=1 Tax=Flavisolibacter ginsengisoli DSM 18119 TaxID=1121884 RepID=A0A1M5FS28_9BACT|nr:hypothetical protein [Flavisolibacter ginsengisoli]SHF94325.1 hypothetical protein SAMN02745131_03928 [Flavisolibacter ginsengisoli DSM 18119]